MPTVHLIEGPVGAGKSTYARALALRTGGVHMALDAWFSELFSPDRPPGGFAPAWYVERKDRLLGLMWRHSQQIVAAGTDVVLELGLIQRDSRGQFCRQVQDAGLHLKIHVLDAPRDVRLERVRRRNLEQGPTFSMVVPDQVFEIASDMWEAPDDLECGEYEIEFVMT